MIFLILVVVELLATIFHAKISLGLSTMHSAGMDLPMGLLCSFL